MPATSVENVLLALILDHLVKNGWHQAAEQLRNEAHSKGSASANLPPAFVESHYSFLTEWFGMFWEYFKRRANSSYLEIKRPHQNPLQQNAAVANINVNLPNNHTHNPHIQHQQYIQHQQQLQHHQNSFPNLSNHQQSPHQDMNETISQLITGQNQTPHSMVATATATQANLRNQIRPRGTPTPPPPPPSTVQQSQHNPHTPTSYINPLDISKQYQGNTAAAAAAAGNINMMRSNSESLRKNGATSDNPSATALALQQHVSNQKKRPSAGSANVSMDSAVIQANIRAGVGSQIPNGPKKRARVNNTYSGITEEVLRNFSSQQQQQMFQARFQHHQSPQSAELRHQHQFQAMAQMEGYNHQQLQHQQSNPIPTPGSRRNNNNNTYVMMQQQQQARELQQLQRRGGPHQKMGAQNGNQNNNLRKNNNVADLNTSSALELLGDNGNNTNTLAPQQLGDNFNFMMGAQGPQPGVVGMNNSQNRGQGSQQQRGQYGARMSKKGGANKAQLVAASAVAAAAANSDRNSTGGPTSGAYNGSNPGEGNMNNIGASQQQRTTSFTTGGTANGIHDGSDNKGIMRPPYGNQSQTTTGRIARTKGGGGGSGGGSGVNGIGGESNGDTKGTTGGGTPSQMSVASGVSNGVANQSGVNTTNNNNNNNNNTTTSSRKSKTNRAKRTSRTGGRRSKNNNNNTTSPSASRKGNNGAEGTSNVTKKSPKKSSANNNNSESKSTKKGKSGGVVGAASGSMSPTQNKKGNNNNSGSAAAGTSGLPVAVQPNNNNNSQVVAGVVSNNKKDNMISADEFQPFSMDNFMYGPPMVGGVGVSNIQSGAGQGQGQLAGTTYPTLGDDLDVNNLLGDLSALDGPCEFDV